MNKVPLLREKETEKETTGIIVFKEENNLVHTLYTLELPWRNNKKKISCIPKGTYDVIYTYSQKLKIWSYEILNVKGRSGIRIHSMNYYYQSQGCIALGMSLYDLNQDKELDTTGSRKAVSLFEDTMKRQPFTLTIL